MDPFSNSLYRRSAAAFEVVHFSGEKNAPVCKGCMKMRCFVRVVDMVRPRYRLFRGRCTGMSR